MVPYIFIFRAKREWRGKKLSLLKVENEKLPNWKCVKYLVRWMKIPTFARLTPDSAFPKSNEREFHFDLPRLATSTYRESSLDDG